MNTWADTWAFVRACAIVFGAGLIIVILMGGGVPVTIVSMHSQVVTWQGPVFRSECKWPFEKLAATAREPLPIVEKVPRPAKRPKRRILL